MNDHSIALSRSLAPLVPRYVANINTFGFRRGFLVRDCVLEASEEYHDRGQNHLIGEWRGTIRQFLALKWTRKSYRIPITDGHAPMRMTAPIHMGYLYVEGKALRFRLFFGLAPQTLEQRDNVEVIHYGSRIAYHGTVDHLVRLGIPKPRVIIRTQCHRRSGSSVAKFGRCDWESQLFADKTVLYTVDTEVAEWKLIAWQAESDRKQREWARKYGVSVPADHCPPQKPFLRLVIDNTREV